MDCHHDPPPPTESLTVEFKNDRGRLSDHDLVLVVVCLANTDGGEIWLGVEDDGTPTGLHPEHMDILGLAGMVASRTVPPVSVRAEAVRIGEVTGARIEVPRSERLEASSAGTHQRRRLRFDGRHECVPFLPHEFVTRQSNLRLGEQEIQVGMFRVTIPTLDRGAFREALVNALTHRDYTRLGAVHIRLEMGPGEEGPSAAAVSSPCRTRAASWTA